MFVNGVVSMDQTDFDPYTGIWTSIHPELAAETAHCSDDVIGTVSNAAGFSNALGQTSQNVWGGMSDLALDQVPACSRFQKKWGAFPTLFYTWTS